MDNVASAPVTQRLSDAAYLGQEGEEWEALGVTSIWNAGPIKFFKWSVNRGHCHCKAEPNCSRPPPSCDGWGKNFCGRNKLESAVCEAADAADILLNSGRPIGPRLVLAKTKPRKTFWSQAMTQCDPWLAAGPAGNLCRNKTSFGKSYGRAVENSGN